jgi:hypothetical protein
MPIEPQNRPEANLAKSDRLTDLPYFALALVGLLLVPIYLFLVPPELYAEPNSVRALVLAFLCGGAVGMTEISSRYRDEQMKAILSPDGLVYILCNGAISTFALVLIFHFRDTLEVLKVFKDNTLGAAIVAGFGASAIMRTRIAVIKGADNKDISIGPDIVINLLLAMIDRRIDRWRASQRQGIIARHIDRLKELGTVDEASKYLLASLISFQNLSEPEKKELSDTIRGNKELGYSQNIQLAAMGYLFLTVVGEENFDSVLAKAKQIQGTNLPPPVVGPPPVPPQAVPQQQPAPGSSPVTSAPTSPQAPPTPAPPATPPPVPPKTKRRRRKPR